VTFVSVIAEELRGPMKLSDSKDASEQAPRSERAELPETLFGYSRSSGDRIDAEGDDVDVSALE
jgi:hypothetical protein